MKKHPFYKFIVLIFLLSFNTVFGNGNPEPENKRVKALIQVWGLVKYRSTNGAQGKFNADSTFLALVNKVKQADKNQFEALILALLKENPGKPQVNKPLGDQRQSLTKNIAYSWTKHRVFTAAVKKELFALTITYHPNDEHYFIPKVYYEGKIPHENTYLDYKFNDEAMNLLALAKAWNAIVYLFPYRYVMDQKWDVTLAKLIPVFSGIKSRAAYEKSILLLATALDDTHASGFLTQVKSKAEIFDLKYYPPFVYKIYRNQLLITAFLNDSLAQRSALKVGDVIVSIGGIKTNEWLKQRASLLPASNQGVKNRLLTSVDAYAFSALHQEIKVKVKRANRPFDLQLELLERNDKNTGLVVNTYYKQKAAQDQLIKPYEDLPNDVALISAGYFFDKDLPKADELMNFSENLNKKKAIIFDMRKYPAAPGLFYYYIPMALGKPAFKFAQYFGADLSNPGAFTKKDDLAVFLSKDIKTTMPLYQGKIVILTNENTQSMGEWFTMMLRQINSNTVVIGSQTAGADGDLKYLNLPGGYEFLFTGNGIFYPNGKETQRVGILPDVRYRPSIAELLSTKDSQLEKALVYLRNE
jgi:carboxyl-terminal processing protease